MRYGRNVLNFLSSITFKTSLSGVNILELFLSAVRIHELIHFPNLDKVVVSMHCLRAKLFEDIFIFTLPSGLFSSLLTCRAALNYSINFWVFSAIRSI